MAASIKHTLVVDEAEFTVEGKMLTIEMASESFEFEESSVAEIVDFLKDYLLDV